MKKLLALLLLAAAPAARSEEVTGALFPVAFSVEHRIVQTEPGGETFRGESVVDTYGGSMLVSVRPRGSRVIVDFAKRTVTEVSVEKSTYWTLSFSQMGDLTRRLQKADERPLTESARTTNASASPEIRLEEVRDGGREPLATPDVPAPRAGVRRFRAWVDGGLSADVWVDGSVRLAAPAMDAVEAFEREALSGGTVGVPARLVAAARRAANGGVAVRVRRPLSAAGGVSEDVVTALTPLAVFPRNLLAVGDGFRRVASPLEEMVAFAEEEASRDSSRLRK